MLNNNLLRQIASRASGNMAADSPPQLTISHDMTQETLSKLFQLNNPDDVKGKRVW